MSDKIGREFMIKTRYEHLVQSDQAKGLEQPPLELPIDSDSTLISLPDPAKLALAPKPLLETINIRRSLRNYSKKPWSLEELSYLLWCTQGIKEIMPGHATLRTVPSAGARHAFETLILANRVANLKPGLYRYAASKHSLVEYDLSDTIGARVAAACLDQKFIARCGATFVWFAVLERMAWRYGQRGYRYLHLDAGHIGQNLYLAAESIGGGACGIAAFDDQKLNELLGLNGEESFVVYLCTTGKKP